MAPLSNSGPARKTKSEMAKTTVSVFNQTLIRMHKVIDELRARGRPTTLDQLINWGLDAVEYLLEKESNEETGSQKLCGDLNNIRSRLVSLSRLG